MSLRTLRVALVMGALALSPCGLAVAQDADDTDDDWDDDLVTDPVVVRGTSEAEELEQSSDSVRVIDTAEVRTQSADMGEVVARTEGMSVRRMGGLGSDERVCIQGVCGRGVRTFLDGVPLELAGFGSGLANVPLHLIERVEVYRGAVPLRLGTDALGGAINLVRSTSYFDAHAGGSLQVGSWGTYRLAYDAGVRDGPTGLYAGVQAFYDRAENDYWVDVDAHDARGRPFRARIRRFHDRYEAYGIAVETGFVGASFADRLTLRAFVSENDRDIQNNLTMAVPYGEAVQGEVSAGGLLRFQHALTDELEVDAYVGYTRRDISFLDASPWVYDWFGRQGNARRVPGEVQSRARDEHIWQDSIPARLNLSWQITPEHALHLNVTPEHTSRSGDQRIEWEPGARDPLTARRELFRMVSGLSYEMTLFGGALENQLYVKDYVYLASSEEALPGSIFVARSRESHDVGVGEGLRVRLLDGLFVRGSYELATRLPDAFEVFGDGGLIGHNLELAPERSHNGTLEVSVDVPGTPIGDVTATAAGFVRQRQNLIFLSVLEAPSYQNLSEALVIGAEASAEWVAPERWVTLGANATYLDDRSTSSEGVHAELRGDRIPNQAYFFANFVAQLRAENVLGRDALTLTWRARYVHDFFRGWESQGDPDREQIIPPQLGQDLALTYTVLGPPRISTSIEITNLGDEALYDNFRVQRPGRAGYVKLTINY